MSKSVDLILSAVKSAGEAALRLHEESESLRRRATAKRLMQSISAASDKSEDAVK